MPETNLTRQGIALIKEGRLVQAAETLELALAQNPNDLQAWIWLSAAVDNDAERLECMQQVLRIDPQHAAAQKAVAVLSAKLGVPAEPPPAPAETVDFLQPAPEEKIPEWEQSMPVEAAPLEEQKAPAWDTLPLEASPVEQTPPDWSVKLENSEPELAAWQEPAGEAESDLPSTVFSEGMGPVAGAGAASGLGSIWLMGAGQEAQSPGVEPPAFSPAPTSEPATSDWAEGLLGGTQAAPSAGGEANWAAEVFAAETPAPQAETAGEMDWLTEFAAATPETPVQAETEAASQSAEAEGYDWFIQQKEESRLAPEPEVKQADGQAEAEWAPDFMASLRSAESSAPAKGAEAAPAESFAPDWLTEELVENDTDNGFVEVLPPLESETPEKTTPKTAETFKKKKKRSPLTFVLQVAVLVILVGTILTLAFLLVTQPQAMMDTLSELLQPILGK